MIKAVLMDVDNTLLDFNECARCSMLSAADDFGLIFPHGFFEVFQKINDGLWREIEQGKLTREGLYKVRWNMIFDALGMEADGEEFEKNFLEYLRSSAQPVDGAVELLEYLSSKYIVCVASNAPYEQQEQRLNNAGMLQFVRALFVSEEIGAAKPSKEFFDYCCERLKPITKDEIIIIGDSLTADIQGGYLNGIRTCWYNHSHAQATEKNYADYIVDSLLDIKYIL